MIIPTEITNILVTSASAVPIFLGSADHHAHAPASSGGGTANVGGVVIGGVILFMVLNGPATDTVKFAIVIGIVLYFLAKKTTLFH